MKVAKVAKEIKKSVESHAHKFGSKSESGEGNQEKCKIACPETRVKVHERRRKTRKELKRMPGNLNRGKRVAKENKKSDKSHARKLRPGQESGKGNQEK